MIREFHDTDHNTGAHYPDECTLCHVLKENKEPSVGKNKMKPFLFTLVPEENWESRILNRRLLNDTISKVNEWTRAGCAENSKDLLLAEIDLTRRTLLKDSRCGQWFFDELNKLIVYIVDGIISDTVDEE